MHLLAQVATGAATSATTEGGAEAILFWVFASIALGSGIAMVVMRNVVHAALMLVLNFLCIAGLYLGLQSSFLSIVQIIVYAGAIVVLFLFVIMLLGVSRDDLLGTKSVTRTVGAVMIGVLLAGGLLAVVGADSLTDASACGALAVEGDGSALRCIGFDEQVAGESDSVTRVGERLFTRWTYPFELAALLLVVATLGALVLGRRKDPAITDEDVVDLEAERALAEITASREVSAVVAEGTPVDEMLGAEPDPEVEDHYHGGYGHGDHTGHDHSMLPETPATPADTAAPADDHTEASASPDDEDS